MILLVEDEQWLSDLYSKALQKNGHSVLVAATAMAAMDLLEDNAKQIQLVVLDVLLPEHNGIEVLYEKLSHSDIADIPVIMLSNIALKDLNLSEHTKEMLSIVEVMDKSKIKPAELAARVEKVLL